MICAGRAYGCSFVFPAAKAPYDFSPPHCGVCGVVVTPLSVCLSVCDQDSSASGEGIVMKCSASTMLLTVCSAVS